MVVESREKELLHSLHRHRPPVLHDDLVHLGVAGQVEVGVLGAGRVHVGVRAVGSTAGLGWSPTPSQSPASLMLLTITRLRLTHITVDPFQPVLGSVTRRQILQVVHGRDVLRLGGSQKVVLDGVCAEKDGDVLGRLRRERRGKMMTTHWFPNETLMGPSNPCKSL